MNQLEALLNSLIKMGWKPWGNLSESMYFHGFTGGDKLIFECPYLCVSLRELVSLESGLWRFVCENRVVKENDDVRIKNYQGDNECDTNCCYDDYEYRLIESALIPEEELEKFLLDNIKVEGK